jgi:hypothetical protein
MAPQVSGSLAKFVSTNAAGSRLRLLHPVRALEPAVKVWPQAGLILATSLTGFVILATAILSISMGWHVLLAIFAGLYIVIVALGIPLSALWVIKRQRWLELRVDPTPAQVAVVGGWRSRREEVIAMADLHEVVVRQRSKLGYRSALDIMLRLYGGKELTCHADIYSMKKISPNMLAGWLEQQLSPFDVSVRVETEAVKEFQCPEQWWPPAKVASMWQVPVGQVAVIAGQRKVRGYAYTPRGFAMYSPHRTVTVYDPGRAWEVAMELHAERACQ